MKIKKYIGKEINGFLILDTYVKLTENGKQTRKVKIRCTKCGREFERASSVDFDHIKCKCMCKYIQIQKKHYSFVTYNNETLNMAEFCRKYNLNKDTTRSRIDRGVPIDEIVNGEFKSTCKFCGEEFISNKPGLFYCCKTHKRRGVHNRPYKEERTTKCIVCGKEFQTLRDDALTCSRECRLWNDRTTRNKRYNHLREQGLFDNTVTLNHVYEKWNGTCAFCQKHLTFDCSFISDDYPSIDHIKPLSKGGTHTWDNVQLLCRRCNILKGAK